jgi:hypothetical protein
MPSMASLLHPNNFRPVNLKAHQTLHFIILSAALCSTPLDMAKD